AALSTYRQQLDATQSTADKPVYHKLPVKDWCCHPADAFRCLAMAYRYDLIIDEQRIGYPGAMINEEYLTVEQDDYDPLGGRVTRR
ncbi:unnamed protein product, partial [marine sediment metagenome]